MNEGNQNIGKINHSSDNIIFFDGICNLCNSSIDFVIKRDKKRQFKYASLQSQTAKEVLDPGSLDLNNPASFILYYDGKIQRKSSAALFVLTRLGFPYRLAGIFLIIPRFIRNWFYDLIARNRYSWFGQRDTCRLPTDEEKELFLS